MLLECSTAPLSLTQCPSYLLLFDLKENEVAQVCPKQQVLPSPIPWSWAQSILVSALSCTKFSLQCMFHILCSPTEDIPQFPLYALDHMEFSHQSDP